MVSFEARRMSSCQTTTTQKASPKRSWPEKIYVKTIQDDLENEYLCDIEYNELVNPNKPGKVRRVLNGASKFHSVSLNQSLLPNLLRLLLRLRQHKFALSADIEGMFLQVGVIPADQPSLRFLWREDPTSEVTVFQYTLRIFGARNSPTCANFALQQTARDNYASFKFLHLLS